MADETKLIEEAKTVAHPVHSAAVQRAFGMRSLHLGGAVDGGIEKAEQPLTSRAAAQKPYAALNQVRFHRAPAQKKYSH